MTAYRIIPPSPITPLKERSGAPRHADEKTAAIVKAVTEQLLGPLERNHRAEIQAMREIAERIEHGYAQLAKTFEAFAIGDEEVAIAGIVDGESKQLPNLPRYKADPTVVYRLTATDIGKRLGISHGMVSYFLGPIGLNWVAAKPKLWNGEFFRMTKRRLWHPDVVELLAAVIVDPDHADREMLTETCARRMDDLAKTVRAALESG